MPAFWFHYNRPASLEAGTPKMTVHYRRQCWLVDEVQCNVPVRSRQRKSQPRVVMSGRGVVRIRGGVAEIKET